MLPGSPARRPRPCGASLFESAHDSYATHALLDHARRRSTGRLSIPVTVSAPPGGPSGTSTGELSLWVLDGTPVGARSPDDSAAIIERLARQGHLSQPRSRQLLGMVQSTTAAKLQHDPILALLADEIETPTFERALRERFEENVSRFVGSSASPTWTDDDLPWCDNVQTTVTTTSLVERCVLDWDLSQALDDRRMLVSGPLHAESHAERAAQAAVGRTRAAVSDIVTQLDLEPIAARVAVVRMIDRGVLTDPPGEFFPRPDRGGPAWHPGRAEPWSASRSEALGGRGEAPSRLDAHPTPTGATLDEEVEAFSGALDASRSGGVSDAFTTPAHRLDRIDLQEPERDAEAAFGAPTLADREVLAKLDVANEVLGNVCRAVDLARGPGRGAAVIQLLVDARPRQFAPLVDGVKLGHTGSLPIQVVLSNLRRRPGGEQRRLLNDCLLDLLDRALDKAADELPDDAFERLLQKVMGYRTRLGL
jgi:hypothetical protein